MNNLFNLNTQKYKKDYVIKLKLFFYLQARLVKLNNLKKVKNLKNHPNIFQNNPQLSSSYKNETNFLETFFDKNVSSTIKLYYAHDIFPLIL